MNCFAVRYELTLFIIAAVCLNRAQRICGADEFVKCYNTSMETHCFQVQYETNQLLHTSFDTARSRCNNLNSTLIIIKDEKMQSLIETYLNDPFNPVRTWYIWTDAYRVNDYNKTYTWHWLDSTLQNVSVSDVADIRDRGWYVASLTYNGNNFYITAQQPYLSDRYLCEYKGSNCSSFDSSNSRQFDGKCYVASNDKFSWYEARNRCLKGGGDLASFADVKSINFTSWLASDSNVWYWIGLRYTWYIWIDTGEQVRYAKWMINNDGWDSSCLAVFYGSNGYSWYPEDCTSNGPYVVCHTVTAINPLTSTTTTTTSSTITITSALVSSESSQGSTANPFKEHSESRTPNVISIGVGVGVGVGVPVLVAVIVLIICIVVRKRRLETASSVQPANRQLAESSIDQPFETQTTDERSEVGDNTTYGVVIPSKSPREADDVNEANSPAEQTVYAPLQIL